MLLAISKDTINPGGTKIEQSKFEFQEHVMYKDNSKREWSFQQKVLEHVEICIQKNKVGPFLTLHTKINSKWVLH